MAKRKGVSGWHAMRKEELVGALARLAKSSKASRNGSSKKSRSEVKASRNRRIDRSSDPSPKPRSPRVEKKLQQVKDRLAVSKDLTSRGATQGRSVVKDRLICMVRDPYWLHVYWELTRATIQRAQAAMGQHWHGARPVLRLSEVARNGTTSSVRKHLRDIEIHGGANNWYVDVRNPPQSYQFDIGYLALNGKFLSVAKSNVVTTPRVGSPESSEANWSESSEDYDRIYALSGGYSGNGDTSDLKELFEQRLQRSMSPLANRFGIGAGGLGMRRGEFGLEVDAELVVYGVTSPGSHVTVKGEPVKLGEDGTFCLRFDLPDRRQVLPVVASSNDGGEQRTIVLAVERNTKVMEPVLRDPDACVNE